jgi:glycosyltransferase involved in cell wall biosynthesis
MSVSAQPKPRIRTLLAMACDGVGPSETCLSLARGAHRAGYPIDVFASRSRVGDPGVPMTLSLPGPLAHLPYRWTGAAASRRIERQFLEAIRPGEIAYLWPAASLQAHRILAGRGIPVVLEAINTRMASAKRILDEAYDGLGLPPGHGITQARIDEEEEKFRHATAIFAPSRHVEAALAGSPLEGRILISSYGVDTSRATPPQEIDRRHARDSAAGGRGLTVLFCGYVCVRKGAHLLLEAWRRIQGPHRLQFVGRIEPAIAERYRDLLASDRVDPVGFIADVHPRFARADIFVLPSLEEGDPLVTYEAAIHGLPILATPAGAGRLGDTPGAVLTVDEPSVAALTEALQRLIASADLRAELGRTARARVMAFDWLKVGADRARALDSFLQTHPGVRR